MTVTRSGAPVVGPLSGRPVRVLPDGRSGVVYCGLVYPLYQDMTIDLDDTAIEKAGCQGFVTDRSDLRLSTRQAATVAAPVGGASPGGRPHRWHLETNGHGHYLLFDSSETVAGLLTTALAGSPLGMVRWGESHRPSDDGEQYDWFARLDFSGSREDCLRHVRSIVDGRPVGVGDIPRQAETSPEAPALDRLREKLAVDLDEQRLAFKALWTSHQRLDQEHTSLQTDTARRLAAEQRTHDSLVAKLSAAVSEHEARQAELVAQIETLQEHESRLLQGSEVLDTGLVAGLETELASTRTALDQARSQLRAAPSADELLAARSETEKWVDEVRDVEEQLTATKQDLFQANGELTLFRERFDTAQAELVEAHQELQDRDRASTRTRTAHPLSLDNIVVELFPPLAPRGRGGGVHGTRVR